MSRFYTRLCPRGQLVLAVAALAFLALALPARADAVKDFAKTLDGFSKQERTFPEDFEAYGFDDRKVALDFGPGKPWRLINFWAAWCPPCIMELPSLKNLQDRARGVEGFEVLLVSADMPADGKALKYLIKQKNLPDVDALYVKDFYLMQNFDVEGLPTTILVNPEGKIVYTFVGDGVWDSPAAMAFFKAVLPKTVMIP